MNVVYIYGPPAAGKLTVAKEVAALTGYRIFHNHLSIDCVLPVFEFGTDPFWRLVHSIRESILAEAAREGVDLIFTTVYNHPGSVPQTGRRFHAIESNGGRICLVQLTCSVDALEARVEGAHRGEMGKIDSVSQLRQVAYRSTTLSRRYQTEKVSVSTIRSYPRARPRAASPSITGCRRVSRLEERPYVAD